MSDYILLMKVDLSSYEATGKTKHFYGSMELSKPDELRIVQYHGDSGFYLFYCDKSGEEVTDTYHDTMESAFKQAEWEFNVKPDAWTKLHELK